MKQTAEAAQEDGNTIEVWLQIDCNAERTPLPSHKGTLDDTQSLGSSFEQIAIHDVGFYVALNKNYEKIFFMFGAGVKLIYGDKITEYVEKAIVGNIEEYALVKRLAILKDAQYEDYHEWPLLNPPLCWPP
ncbi:hypothetical protein B9Z19DRAFT_1062954 [Tuber borchii]|uniref:Uncharacterized protein n=1 Tax=Tuber borchii TaxID=42251 RepID=A0A2T7A038_TUBBO|nr:hypothetical protein B9Z19DRAFT_1062954 [Tuber borchii]